MVAVADLDHMAAGAALERWGSELSDPFTSDHRTSTPWPAPDALRTATLLRKSGEICGDFFGFAPGLATRSPPGLETGRNRSLTACGAIFQKVRREPIYCKKKLVPDTV